MTAQKSFEIIATEINYLVKQRGYLDGYTANQLIARNIVKAFEELAEASEHVILDPAERFTPYVEAIGSFAKERFDSKWWTNCGPTDVELLKSEIADLFVVLSVLVKQIEAHTGSRYDVAELALDKARDDVARGVRIVKGVF